MKTRKEIERMIAVVQDKIDNPKRYYFSNPNSRSVKDITIGNRAKLTALRWVLTKAGKS